MSGIEQMGRTITGNFDATTLGKNLVGIGMRGVVNAGVGQAVYGREAGSFGRAWVSSLAGDLAAVGANAVGKLSAGPYSPSNILGHAAVGAAAARMRGQDPWAGAIGAGMASIINPTLDRAIGGPDGMGWGADPASAQYNQQLTLQLSSTLAAGAVLAATRQEYLTAMQAAHNETINNYLDHHRPGMLRLSEKERYENAVRDCANGNATACRTRDVWAARSNVRGAALAEACSPRGSWMACQHRIQEARGMGNRVGRRDGWVYAHSPDAGPISQLNNTASIGAPSRPNNFHDELAMSTAEGLTLIAPNYLPASIGAMGLTKSTAIWSGIGGGIAGTMDALGQYHLNGTVRWEQSLFTAATAAATTPWAMTSGMTGNILLGAASGAANTAFKNIYFGDSNSVIWGGVFGGASSALGYKLGMEIKSYFPVYPNKNIAALLQKPDKTGFYIGNIGSNIIQNLPNTIVNTDVQNKILP